MERPLKRGHEKGVDLARENCDLPAVKVTRDLGDSRLHEVSGLTAIGDEGLCLSVGAPPDGMRCGSYIWPDWPSGSVHFSVPPKRSFSTAHTAPDLPAARLGGRSTADGVRGARAAIFGRAGDESR